MAKKVKDEELEDEELDEDEELEENEELDEEELEDDDEEEDEEEVDDEDEEEDEEEEDEEEVDDEDEEEDEEEEDEEEVDDEDEEEEVKKVKTKKTVKGSEKKTKPEKKTKSEKTTKPEKKITRSKKKIKYIKGTFIPEGFESLISGLEKTIKTAELVSKKTVTIMVDSNLGQFVTFPQVGMTSDTVNIFLNRSSGKKLNENYPDVELDTWPKGEIRIKVSNSKRSIADGIKAVKEWYDRFGKLPKIERGRTPEKKTSKKEKKSKKSKK